MAADPRRESRRRGTRSVRRRDGQPAANPLSARLTTAAIRPCRAAAFEIGGLDRIGESLAKGVGIRSAIDLKAIDDDLEQRSIAEGRRVDIVDRDGPAVDQQTREAFFAQVRERGRDGVVAG